MTEYASLTDARRNIDDHVQYNRTWQREIARLRAAYDTGTHLHDAVLERQATLDALDATDDAAFRAALKGVTGVDRAQPRAALDPQLRVREAALATEIHDVIDKITPPKFLRVERRTIVLGPQGAGPHLLAHEFGHMIGFRDEYFRGYRDLGADGFQVMEVVAEPDDVMGNPGAGWVRRHMFERLIAVVGGG